MPPELALKAITHLVLAVLIITVLLVLLVAVRKEINGEQPFMKVVQLGLFIMGLCTFIALMTAYFQAKKVIVPERVSQHMDTVSAQQAIRFSNT